jgi:hypothetical protein
MIERLNDWTAITLFVSRFKACSSEPILFRHVAK